MIVGLAEFLYHRETKRFILFVQEEKQKMSLTKTPNTFHRATQIISILCKAFANRNSIQDVFFLKELMKKV